MLARIAMLNMERLLLTSVCRQGSFEERLAAYLGKQIREDQTAVYGMAPFTFSGCC